MACWPDKQEAGR